jgi:homoserine O-acetyltransferase
VDIDPGLFQENERTASGRLPTILTTGSFSTESGGILESVDIGYLTFGELNLNKDNAILVCHALSGNANCQQWWDRMIGPGKPIDTDKYFVVGVNSLGGCDGSTGPSSISADGRPYGSRFPMITIGDMVAIQDRLREYLRIESWLLVCGGSMGGMQALEWSVQFPNRVRGVWATASCSAHNAMQIGFNEAARQAIIRDPKWQNGDYDPNDPPAQGLSVARMIGHLSFLSESAFAAKFGRRLQDKEGFEFTWQPEFQVESYLNYQGNKFTRRFDPNSLLVLTRAIDYYDLKSFEAANAKYLFTSFTSDWLYLPDQSRTLCQMVKDSGLDATWLNIDVSYGHDAFLLDSQQQGLAVRNFLEGLNVQESRIID